MRARARTRAGHIPGARLRRTSIATCRAASRRAAAAIRCRSPTRSRATLRRLGHRRRHAGGRLRRGATASYAARAVVAAALARPRRGRGARRRARRLARAPACRSSARAARAARRARFARARREPTRARARPTRSRALLAARATPAARCARAPSASRAESSRSIPWPGTCPARVNHPFARNLGADGRFLPAAELRAALARARSAAAPPRERRRACAAPASPPATICSRSKSPGLPARASTPARGASGSAIRRGRSRRGAVSTCGIIYIAPQFCYRARRSLTAARPTREQHRAQVRPPPAGWKIDDSARALPGGRLGQGLLLHQRRRPRRRAPGPAARPRDRPARGRRGPEGARPAPRRSSCASPTSSRTACSSLHDAFAQAIAENDYQNRYAAVFPIKVNQQRLVVEEVYRYGKRVRLRPRGRLQARAAGGHGDDRERARPADRLQRLQGRQLHRGGDARHQARPHDHPGGRELRRARPDPQARAEATACARASACASSSPARAPAAGASRPARSPSSACSSPRSSSCSACCKQHDMLDCLQLVHCHPGSQLQDIRRVKDAINELAHVYAELKLHGRGPASTSTSAAASASTTTAAAPTSHRR